MAGLGLTVSVTGAREFTRALDTLRAPQLGLTVKEALVAAALAVQKRATEVEIIRGGRMRSGSRMRSAPPDPVRLTSRSGRLRGSIGVDRRALPFAVSVGSAVEYAAVHELGGPHHPKRAYLAPALEHESERFPAIFSAALQAKVDRARRAGGAA